MRTVAGVAAPGPLPPQIAAQPYEARATELGYALFATRDIAAGTALFGEDDWVDEAERAAATTLPAARLQELPEQERRAFIHFGYNTGHDEVTGTFDHAAVRHPVNFLNHSCDPNIGYDGAESIVALRPIAAGTEIRMDYGTYSFSFDHPFACRCGAPNCRGAVRRDDWRKLVRAGLKLPAFMRERVEAALRG